MQEIKLSKDSTGFELPYEVIPCTALNLISPRLEVRWRDVVYVKEKEKSLYKELLKLNPKTERLYKHYMCGLYLVHHNVMGQHEYTSFKNDTKVSVEDIVLSDLYIPSRMQQDLYNLMLELKIRAFVSCGESYKEVYFPTDLNTLAYSIKSKVERY